MADAAGFAGFGLSVGFVFVFVTLASVLLFKLVCEALLHKLQFVRITLATNGALLGWSGLGRIMAQVTPMLVAKQPWQGCFRESRRGSGLPQCNWSVTLLQKSTADTANWKTDTLGLQCMYGFMQMHASTTPHVAHSESVSLDDTITGHSLRGMS